MKTLLRTCFVAVFIVGGAIRAQAVETNGGPDQYFLNAGPNIKGESTDKSHKDEIEVYSFSFGATNPALSTSGGGGGTGKVHIQDFVISKFTDKASPALFLACAQGTHIKTVVLTAARGGQAYLTITLTDVLVSSFTSTTPDNPGKLLESLSLNFTKIEISYKPQNADGILGAPQKASWDLKANKGA